MSEPATITIPLINPNEPGALLATLNVSNGQHISRGDRLCTLETTKSTLELTAETDGYVVGLAFEAGKIVQAGDVLAYLADSPEWIPHVLPTAEPRSQPPSPQGMRISQPALRLAQQQNLDLTSFPNDVFITEKMVQGIIDSSSLPVFQLEPSQLEPNSIIVYGGGGHGKALIDLIRMLGSYPIVGVVDDGIPAGSLIMGVRVLGGSAILEQLIEHGIHQAANAVGGIGNIASRITVFERLAKAGFTCPTLVHPIAFVEPSARLAEGVQVMPQAYVGSEAQIGFGAIVNTGAIVSHDCNVSEYANLSPGAILAGEVMVGVATLVGMGVTINLRVRIGSRARIGNGATVKEDVPEGGIVRAGTIWPN